LTLLAYIEALHYACVVMEKWDMSVVGKAYPRAARCHALVDSPVKVKKFLVGRQFFVIFVVFLIAQLTTFPKMPDNFAGLGAKAVAVLAKTGLPGVALVLTFGQLISQLFVEEFTLQFVNMPGNEVVIRLCLATEWCGVCHWSWLLYHVSNKFACSKVVRAKHEMDAEEAAAADGAMSPTARIRGPNYDNGLEDQNSMFDLFRYLWSSAISIFSVVVVCYGISQHVYLLHVPPIAAFIIAFTMLSVLFYLEGLMIAIAATQYWDPEQFREVYPRAYAVHRLINQEGGDGVKRFIIGRQFFTVLTGFLLAEIFTFYYWDAGSYDPTLFYVLVKSGLVGVLIVLSFGQLNPELLAAEYPLRFMNLRGSYTVCWFSMVFDALGVGHCGWATYFGFRSIFLKYTDAEGEVQEGMEGADEKPQIMTIKSAELFYRTGSPDGRPQANVAVNNKPIASTSNTQDGKV
jgi:hypothetical protein